MMAMLEPLGMVSAMECCLRAWSKSGEALALVRSMSSSVSVKTLGDEESGDGDCEVASGDWSEVSGVPGVSEAKALEGRELFPGADWESCPRVKSLLNKSAMVSRKMEINPVTRLSVSLLFIVVL